MKSLRALVYDSGAGGLNVFEKLVKIYDGVRFFYVSDRLNCPYGNKTEGELKTLSSKILESVNVESFDFAVIACNTLSVNCLDYFNEKYKIPFFGIFPPLDLSGKTLLICTRATALSGYLANPPQNYKIFPCADLAKDIEDNIFRLDELFERKYARYFPIESYANVILGCTHYLFLKKRLLSLYPDSRFWDGSETLCKSIEQKFDIEKCENPKKLDHLKKASKSRFVGDDGNKNFRIFTEIFNY